ncbi:MAG: glutamine--fructose-6-phosphate aminotransferase, partial [Thermodesulfobacteriota bacterium]
LFEALSLKNFNISNLTNKNIIVLKNLQGIIHQVKGATLYQIDGLTLLGEPTEETTISIISKEGTSSGIPSRIEKDNKLKGTKRIIVSDGNVYIGKGRKDGRSILIIPIISPSHTSLNTIQYLYLMEVSFKSDVPLADKIKALGGKYERIKNIVQENSLVWEDGFLDRMAMEELFGSSAEKIGEKITASGGI